MPLLVTPQLMFEGNAEEAMNFYTSLFSGSEITQIARYGPGEPAREGSVFRAIFKIGGQQFNCIDSPVKHDFTFTPSMSFVECESAAELESAFNQLSAGGRIMMPLGNYGFSLQFGWVNDRFGVSWQLNLNVDTAVT